MGMAVTCDRCGKTIGVKTFERKGAVIRTPDEIFSLCDECQKTLLKWLKKEEEHGLD